ncbi:MAG: galactitol-1-phosphate 5-dehydrogenase, partial [Planctomycetes bacterium]|nr:galactitol-1-phosphate 5-dehydrogenase [Planctomycetota bacterium]
LIGNVAPEVPLPLQTAVTRELTLAGSCASAGEYPACLDLIARGAVRLDPLLSAVAPLAEGAAWFARLREGAGDLMKVVLVP